MVKVKVIRGTDFTRWQQTRAKNAALRTIKKSSLDKRQLKVGDLVVEISGGGPSQPVGRVIRIDEETIEESNEPLICSNFFRLLRLNNSIDPCFVENFLKLEYFRGSLDQFQTQTTNLRNLRYAEFLAKTLVPSVPIAEQCLISTKLSRIAAHLGEVKARLATIPSLLKRFRQSILAAACSGRLTEDWRANNCLHAGWPVKELASVGVVSGGITKNSNRNKLPLKVPYLRVANVYENRLDLDEIKSIGITEQELDRTLLVAGDILIVEGNGSIDQIGRVALWSGEITRCSHQNHLIRFRAGCEVLPKYVLFWLMSSQGRELLMNKATSTSGLHTLSISKISSIAIPIPSLAEQVEIVQVAENQILQADAVEARYNKAMAFVDKLMPSILAKAFRGELA